MRKPRRAFFTLIAIVLCAIALLPFLKFDNDIYRSFSSGSVHSGNYASLLSRLDVQPGEIIVVVLSEKGFEPDDYEHFIELTIAYGLVEDVAAVLSPINGRFPADHPAYPMQPVFHLDLENGEIESRLADFQKSAPYLRPLVSADRKAAVFAISLKHNSHATTTALAELQTITSDMAREGLTYRFTGQNIIGSEMVRALRSDLLIFNIAGGALALLMAIWIFGRLRLILIAFLPAVLATLVSLSAFVVIGLPITVISNVVPVLVLVLALADSVHLTLHFRDAHSCKKGLYRAARSVIEIGPACALTAATSAMAFAAIATSDNALLRELALIGLLSVLIAYTVVIMSFALLAPLLEKGSGQHSGTKPGLQLPDRFTAFILSKRRLIIWTGLGLTVVLALGAGRLDPWFNLDDNLPVGGEVRQANKTMAQSFGGYFRIWAEVEFDGPETLETSAGWDRLADLTDTIAKAAPDNTVISLTTFARWLGSGKQMPPADQLADLPQQLVRELLSGDGDTARIIVFVPEPMVDGKSLDNQKRIERAISGAGLESVGLPIIMRYESLAVVQQLCLGLALACLVVVAALAFVFRWPGLAILLILPNTLPLLGTAACLILIGDGQITPTAVLALTVAFGIAVDDSIHVINRYRLEKSRRENADEALMVTMRETGRAMIATTVLICIGVAVTLFSAFIMVRLFGLMLIIAFVLALFADLVLLPALLSATARRRFWRPSA